MKNLTKLLSFLPICVFSAFPSQNYEIEDKMPNFEEGMAHGKGYFFEISVNDEELYQMYAVDYFEKITHDLGYRAIFPGDTHETFPFLISDFDNEVSYIDNVLKDGNPGSDGLIDEIIPKTKFEMRDWVEYFPKYGEN